VCLCVCAALRCGNQTIHWNATTHYVPLTKLAAYSKLQTDCYSFLVFLAWCKLLQYCSLFRKFSRLIVMIEICVSKLVPFALLICVSFIAFASAEYIAYGYKSAELSTWLFTLYVPFLLLCFRCASLSTYCNL
jgi:hypothetical protein